MSGQLSSLLFCLVYAYMKPGNTTTTTTAAAEQHQQQQQHRERKKKEEEAHKTREEEKEKRKTDPKNFVVCFLSCCFGIDSLVPRALSTRFPLNQNRNKTVLFFFSLSPSNRLHIFVKQIIFFIFRLLFHVTIDEWVCCCCLLIGHTDTARKCIFCIGPSNINKQL